MNDLANKESGESHSPNVVKLRLIRSRFTFDESEDFPIFNGWYDPTNRYWNGWCNPYFDKPTRDCFISYEKSLIENGTILSFDDDEFMEELYSIESQVIDGKELYYFGGFFCWSEVKIRGKS